MSIVQSLGDLSSISTSQWATINYGSLRMYDQYNYDYATLYKTQPNVRTCVDFLARNIAQLGLHVFRRVSDTDRVRLIDHPLAKVLSTPMPPEFKVTRYRLIETLMGDLGVYFNAYWLKIKQAGTNVPLSLLRIPPNMVTVYGDLVPLRYEMTLSGKLHTFAPDEIVHFRGYNAESAVEGLSPLETLRRVLAEEHAAGEYREGLWRNGARMYGIVNRPANAPEWSDTARNRFKQEFSALYAGDDLGNSGKTAVLEDGMVWQQVSFNAQESEYLAGRKLTREECAREYHIPLPMVGILDNATFSNITEQHKNLYQDSLGPWLAMIEQEIELQLLPELGDTDGVYVEFNIAEKLQGAFEDQVKALQSAVGRPWMTADEARARMNLPSMGGDADELVTPLNVLVGGQASPRDSAPPPKSWSDNFPPELAAKLLEAVANPHSSQEINPELAMSLLQIAAKNTKSAGEVNPTQPALRDKYREQWARLMVRTFERQRAAVMTAAGKSKKASPGIAALWDADRWNTELSQDFFKLSTATSAAFSAYVSSQLDSEFDESQTLNYLRENSRIAAENVNQTTRDEIEKALGEDNATDALKNVFELAITVRALQIATTRTTETANFGTHEAATQGGLKTKTWNVNSKNPRPSHARLSGQTVGIKELFSNGQLWPGDPRGGADENAGCQCSVSFGR